MIRKWDIQDKELSRKCADEVIARIQDIHDTEQVGIVAAQDIVDIVLENMGPEIYNKAINDVAMLMSDKLHEIEYDIEDLKRA